MMRNPKALQMDWMEVSKIIENEMEEILGRRISCEAGMDDGDYWAVRFQKERLPMADLYKLLDEIDATPEQSLDSIPPQEEYADSVCSIGMAVCEILLQRYLGYTWQALHYDEKFFWVLGQVTEDDQAKGVIKITGAFIRFSELRSRKEVMDILFDKGSTYTVLMNICEEYYRKYQNSLCWKYPISDGKHHGTFILLVKEGILGIPYDAVDKVDKEILCMEDACLLNRETMESFVSDWYHFDEVLRHTLADLKRYLQKKEA